ncbi:MAG: hypothetical protein RRA92_02865 [Gemmatimonadota bacterium]|nr:hypothetical protein [Gemmatimonadota bacterium]
MRTPMVLGGWIAAASLLAGGCGGNAGGGETADPQVARPAGTVEGTVRQTGSPPAVQTRLETEDGSVRVVGALAAEVGRVIGAVVRVRGPLGSEAGERTIEARDYQIVSVDGRSPRVGEIVPADDGGLALRGRDGTLTPLRDAPERLRGAIGAWAWVVPSQDGGVARYGILRDP